MDGGAWQAIVCGVAKSQTQTQTLSDFTFTFFQTCYDYVRCSHKRKLDLGYTGLSIQFFFKWGFPGDSKGKASACNTEDPGLIPGREDPLEKEMATHSGTLAWKIPWMEKPGRLQSMGYTVFSTLLQI